nr:hypothetical protein [Marinobacterium profundum]
MNTETSIKDNITRVRLFLKHDMALQIALSGCGPSNANDEVAS